MPALPRGINGLTAQRPTSSVSIFDTLNSNISTYLATRTRDRSHEFVKLLREIRDFTPDVSKAVDNILTLANPGYDLTVYYVQQDVTNDTRQVDEKGLQIIKELASRVYSEYSGSYDFGVYGGSYYPGLNALINMCHLLAFTQGAMACEVQLRPNLVEVSDIFPVDPIFIDHKKDPITLKWTPGLNAVFARENKLMADNKQGFMELNPLLFRYVPKDPDVNQPAGRSPLMSVMDIVFFQQQVYRDLQAVAHQANMPRLDIKIVEEIVNKIIDEQRPDLKGLGNEQARQDFLDNYINDIAIAVNSLSSDDAFIHWDAVEANYISPGGTGVPVKELIEAIDKSIISATKQLPVLLGRNEGATTTHATVQWQVYLLQIKAYQEISKQIVNWLFNLALRIAGRPSYVSFEFHEHRTSDDFLDAQALNMQVNSWSMMVQKGWASNDEASNALLHHNADKQIDPNAQPPIKQAGLPGQPAPVSQDGSAKAVQE